MSENKSNEGEEVTIVGRQVTAVNPEGQRASMELERLIQLLCRSGGRKTEIDCVLPDGVKLVTSRGSGSIWVYERPPQVYSLKWIAADSPSDFGKDTIYRTVRIALPYLIVLAVFLPGSEGRIQLTQLNECFFRSTPLKTPGDEMLYPALLNCSKFEPQAGRPLSWICTTNMNLKRLARIADTGRRVRESLSELLHCLLETGYNRSSEHHEESSWFTASAHVDERICTIENWEMATEEDPLFVLDVPWLRTELTLGQVIDRIFRYTHMETPRIESSADIQRILFNHCGEPISAAAVNGQ